MSGTARYSRLEQLDWWQGEKVRIAVALVAGCGALGNEVLKNLALLGWGNIVLVDFDLVEESNLSRSLFFRQDDIGKGKAHSLASRAKELNPDCAVLALDGELRQVVSAGLIARVDVVFGCVDNIEARLALGDLCGQSGRLWIDGGLTPWEGTVSHFLGGDHPCYACSLTEEDWKELGLRRTCAAYMARARAAQGIPTTPPVASLVGAQMVQSGLKWIHDRRAAPFLQVGSQIRFDTLLDRHWKISLHRSEDCPLHPAPVEVLRGEEFDWQLSWRHLLHWWRRKTGREEVSLHLPVAIAELLVCEECRAQITFGKVFRENARYRCAACGGGMRAELINQIFGSCPFLDSSPEDSGLPPWSWLTMVSPDAMAIFELAANPTGYPAAIRQVRLSGG